MMLAGFLLLLLLRDGTSSNSSCTHQDILNHLNMTKTNEPYSVTRPGRGDKPTVVLLDVLLYAILNMNELDQKFVSYIWMDVGWDVDNIKWNTSEFCGIQQIYLPAKLLWKPDITIEEMTDSNKALPSPYVLINSNGQVTLRDKMVVDSTCKIYTHKFPFDIQSCNLSFTSVIHTDKDIKLAQMVNSAWSVMWSHEMMQTQYEWLFIDMTVNNKTRDNFGLSQTMLVYTINMKRRSALYIANFLLPVLFFFCLDLASFLISDSRGEKLSFKVTVLLAVTVMQLILNEILPSSSDRIPLIALYCIGIFGLMLLSLLETIFVLYLIEKDDEANKDQSLSEDCGGKVSFHKCFGEANKLTCFARIRDVSPGEAPAELLSVAKEGSSSQMTGEFYSSEKLSDELTEAVKTLTLLLSRREEGKKPRYWTRVAKTINKVFLIFYVIAAGVFLFFIFFRWNSVEK